MTTRFGNRTRRRTAMAMLLMRPFALITGVANASLVKTTTHHHPSAQAQVESSPGFQLAADALAHRRAFQRYVPP